MTVAKLSFRRAAVEDLLQIHAYLCEQSSMTVADRLLAAAEQTIAHIRRQPNAGSPFRTQRASLSDLRWWPVAGFPRYLLYYRVFPERVEIVRVLHGARNFPGELGQE